jgi:hypothetical protein
MPTSEFSTAVLFGTDEACEAASEREDHLFRTLLRLLITEADAANTRRGSSVESITVPDANDLVQLLRWGSNSAEFHRRFIRDSYSAEPGDAIRDDDEEQPGKHKIIFRTKEGTETCYRGLPVAAKAEPLRDQPVMSRPLGGSEAARRPQSPEDYWTVFIDMEAPAASRVEAFTALRGSPLEQDAIVFLAMDLSRGNDIQADWRDAAVFVAEDTHFPSELRDSVGEALLHIVSTLRTQQDAPEKVVWSALRRGASLLSPMGVERLLEFLAPGGAVDTRSVALQCVSRMYEAEPPTNVPLAVADRAHRFAERFLDPDVFTPGEPSLIARYAVSALAALGDPRLGDTLGEVRAMGRPWLVRRVRDELNRLYRGWVGRGWSTEQPAVANLGNALASFV